MNRNGLRYCTEVTSKATRMQEITSTECKPQPCLCFTECSLGVVYLQHAAPPPETCRRKHDTNPIIFMSKILSCVTVHRRILATPTKSHSKEKLAALINLHSVELSFGNLIC